jgi:ketosteroid isomerase-like protein
MERQGIETSEQLAIVERVFDLFNRLDPDVTERRSSPVTAELLELFHPDIEFTQPALQPEGAQRYRGREALRESWDAWFEMWESHRSYPEQVRVGGHRVLALSRDHFRGRDGVELEQKGATIFTFDGMQIVRLEAFFDHETATREFER